MYLKFNILIHLKNCFICRNKDEVRLKNWYRKLNG